jgi:hypothetical protein
MSNGGRPPCDEAELAAIAWRIDEWLDGELAANPAVTAVDRDTTPGVRRWFVRLVGDEKATFTVWFTLGQRTLQFETYVMPAPEANHAEFHAHLLRRNRRMYGAAFAIGDEDAIYLVGQLANEALDRDELDRLLGSVYAYVEQFFRPAVQIGFPRIAATHDQSR